MNNEANRPKETDTTAKIVILGMISVVVIGVCALFILAFSWLRSNEGLLSRVLASPTPVQRATATPAPGRTPRPNLTATQEAWVKPAQSPLLASAEEAVEAMQAGTRYLEEFATVIPELPEINQPGDIYTFEIELPESVPLVWSYGWCTTTTEILEENFSHIRLAFLMNETSVPFDHFVTAEFEQPDGSVCRQYAVLVSSWPAGRHLLETYVTFRQDIHDGWNLYPAGTHVFKYFVTVQP
ncbi:MAG TPA: hypothetical protein VNK49_14325 [Anaerolineales bacterium]|nr:hypothetical protein [Anaerolineales bacterium]